MTSNLSLFGATLICFVAVSLYCSDAFKMMNPSRQATMLRKTLHMGEAAEKYCEDVTKATRRPTRLLLEANFTIVSYKFYSNHCLCVSFVMYFSPHPP